MQQVDVKKLLEEDKATEGLDIPYRFGYGFDTNYTLKDGIWEAQDTIRVWKLRISSPGAYSLNFIFKELRLSPEAELHIFNPNGSMVYGPVTARQNASQGSFLTDLIMGDEAIIQLTEPVKSIEQTTFRITRVVHAYKNLFSHFEQTEKSAEILPGIGNALSCHNDINCSPAWTNVSDAVAMVLLSSGDALCSGSLLNNTAQDYRPFFLTAFHCIDRESPYGGLSQAEIDESTDSDFLYCISLTL